MEIERFVQKKVNEILRNNIKLLELSLISALKAIKNDRNVYRYLFHKLDQTAAAELNASMPYQNSLPQFRKSNPGPLVPVNNGPESYSYGHDDLRYHTQKQKPGDYCYACYEASYKTGGVSRTYLENLGKEITSAIGFDSSERWYTIASSHTHRH